MIPVAYYISDPVYVERMVLWIILDTEVNRLVKIKSPLEVRLAMKDGVLHSILRSIRRRIEEEQEKRRKEAERLEYEKVCHFCDGISQEEFDEIVHSVTRKIKRIKKCWTDGSRVFCNVYSQSHISVWQFWIEFNDHGRLSGDWTHWYRENTQSDMAESVADQISEAIKTRYREKRDQ